MVRKALVSETIEDLTVKAKAVVIKKLYVDEGRKWLETEVVPYGSLSERVRFFVLEGSPARGLVVVNYGTGLVSAYGMKGRCIKTYQVPWHAMTYRYETGGGVASLVN